MGVLYSPLLLITAYVETKQAHRVKRNRRRGESDEDETEEWEQLAGECDFEADGWAKKVEGTKPNVATDLVVVEVRELKEQIDALRKMIEAKGEGGKENGGT